jgi:N-acetylmuramic acid 6-phosphate (MurNAc-6-P) etherase
VRIVAAAARLERRDAEELLGRSGGEVKTAIVAARAGLSPEAARDRLRTAGGDVRRAIGND